MKAAQSEATLQHGVNRHCLTKAYLWHVCKGPVLSWCSLGDGMKTSALTSSGKHVAAWCEPTLHICGIGMEGTLQHGVNRHCFTME